LSTAVFALAASIVAVIVAGCAAYKVWQFHRARAAGSAVAAYALVTCLSALAVALALQPPPVQAAIDSVLGASATALALAPGLAMIAICGYQCFVVSINEPCSAPRRIRWRVAVAALAVITLVAAVVAGPDGHPALRSQDPVSYRSDPLGAVVFLTYVGYMGLGGIDVARLAYRFTRLGDVPLLRLGLLMVTGGAYIVALYAGMKLAVFTVGLIVDRNLDLIAEHVTRPLVIVGALLTGIGNTLPSWGRWVGARRPAEWVGLYISHLTLRPLWEALYAVAPQIALHPRSRWADRLLPGDLRFRITRRVVEIQDGLLLLRFHRTAEASARATHLARMHGLQGPDLAAAVEATEIALTIRAAATGVAVAGSAAVPTPSAVTETFEGVTANINHEIHWLTRVTYALRHSPVVRHALADQDPPAAAATATRPRPAQPGAPASPPAASASADQRSRSGPPVPDPRSGSQRGGWAMPGRARRKRWPLAR
jgi:hypothetical protein